MLHHEFRSADSRQAELRDRAARRRPPADAGELERLVQGAAAGDATAWTSLVERFTARIRAVARAHRLAPGDVDDVVQNTWLRLLEHIGRVREPAAVGSWLGTTARREALHVIAGAKRESPSEEHLLDRSFEEDLDAPLVAAERSSAVAASLETLSPRQARLFSLLFDEIDHSYDEISSALGMPIGSIGPTRIRGLERLRKDAHLRELLDADVA
jgi:RNA polymerase sigma factor (sigma-70 family)